jgi:hypothetical protein
MSTENNATYLKDSLVMAAPLPKYLSVKTKSVVMTEKMAPNPRTTRYPESWNRLVSTKERMTKERMTNGLPAISLTNNLAQRSGSTEETLLSLVLKERRGVLTEDNSIWVGNIHHVKIVPLKSKRKLRKNYGMIEHQRKMKGKKGSYPLRIILHTSFFYTDEDVGFG